MSNASVHTSEPRPVEVFAALGDRTRLSLVMRLSDGRPRSIAKLAVDSDLTRQAIAKHLRVLERAGVVKSVPIGRENRFAYRPESILEAKSYLDLVSAQWDDALSRLRSFVERES